jgi:hypothetical protein
MDNKYLHELIVEVLKQKGSPLPVSKIHEIITRSALWFKKNGDIPSKNQLFARICKHAELFEIKNGLVHLINQEKRLLRITWNDNNWEFPSIHKWSKKNQGNTSIAHENQYGFGGEEWLFNQRYNIDGYQYGFIQGLWEVMDTNLIDVAYLFSINQITKDRFLIGKINKVELLDPTDLPKEIKDVYKKYKNEMFTELQNVNADYKKFKLEQFYPIVKFKMSDTDIFDEPRLINELKKGNRYNRFKAYKVDDALQSLIDGKMAKQPFIFSPGKRRNDNSSYTKNSSGRSSFVKGIHAKIVNDLEKYLSHNFNAKLKNISIEKTVFGENIADVVTLNKDRSYSIYEVKTSYNTRYNIREAIGQLLDYALWYDGIKIKELVIVAPSVITPEQIEYLKRVKASLNLVIRYLQHTNNAKDKFIEIVL